MGIQSNPFGVTNGVPVFQRKVDEDGLKHTFPYLDNVTIGGCDQKHLDHNGNTFLKALKSSHMTLNENKIISSVSELAILRYCVGHGRVNPDPERLNVLLELPALSNQKALQRAPGLFAYYEKWIPYFSDCVKDLKNVLKFSLDNLALNNFAKLKQSVAQATLQAFDVNKPFMMHLR